MPHGARVLARVVRGLGTALGVAGRLLPALAVLLLVAVVGGHVLSGSDRSYVVAARTLAVEIEFDGITTWSFARATVCRATLAPRRTAEVSGDAGGAPAAGRCDSRRFEVEEDRPLRLEWLRRYRTEVRVTPDGYLEILALQGEASLPAGSLVVVALADWRGDGVLPFTGVARIGSEVASGNPDILLDGRYEARQTDLLSRWTGWRTTVVQEGLLNRGETVRVVERCEVPRAPAGPLAGSSDPEEGLRAEEGDDRPCQPIDMPGGGRVGLRSAQAYGHLSPPGPTEDHPALYVNVVSARGEPVLELGSFGTGAPILIEPNWIESLIASPVLLAAAVLVSFVANAAQLAGPWGGGVPVALAPRPAMEEPAVRLSEVVTDPPGAAGLDLAPNQSAAPQPDSPGSRPSPVVTEPLDIIGDGTSGQEAPSSSVANVGPAPAGRGGAPPTTFADAASKS